LRVVSEDIERSKALGVEVLRNKSSWRSCAKCEVRTARLLSPPEEMHSTTDISHLTTLTTPSCWNFELAMNGQRCGASAQLFENQRRHPSGYVTGI